MSRGLIRIRICSDLVGAVGALPCCGAPRVFLRSSRLGLTLDACSWSALASVSTLCEDVFLGFSCIRLFLTVSFVFWYCYMEFRALVRIEGFLRTRCAVIEFVVRRARLGLFAHRVRFRGFSCIQRIRLGFECW